MPALRVHAETATRMFTRLDPYVNVLRGTVAAFAAAAGGATSITVLPFDHAIGPPQPRARRIARNTQLVLIEESSLGRVIDPAGGPGIVETLTEQLAAKAWALVQEIERQGGMLPSLSQGYPQDQVAASWTKRPRRDRLPQGRNHRRVGVRRSWHAGTCGRSGKRAAPTRICPSTRSWRIAWARTSSGCARSSDAILARTGERPRVFLCALGATRRVRGPARVSRATCSRRAASSPGS